MTEGRSDRGKEDVSRFTIGRLPARYPLLAPRSLLLGGRVWALGREGGDHDAVDFLGGAQQGFGGRWLRGVRVARIAVFGGEPEGVRP